MATAVLCSRAPNAMPMAAVSRMNAMKPASFGQSQPVVMPRPAALAASTTAWAARNARPAPARLAACPVRILAARTWPRRGSWVKVANAVRWLHSAVMVSMSTTGSSLDRPSAAQVR
jgi:hypothetical protein